MPDEQHPKTPIKNSWDSFKTVGDELKLNQREGSRLGGFLSWICLVMILAAVTLTIVPLLCMICLTVATGGRLLVVNPTVHVNPDKLPIFGERGSIPLFIFALVVWWITNYLAQPIRAAYGANPALLARFAMACVAYAPVVWFMKRQLERYEREEKARHEAIQEEKQRRSEALLSRRDEDD